jgi:hypothetical protein
VPSTNIPVPALVPSPATEITFVHNVVDALGIVSISLPFNAEILLDLFLSK